MTKEEMEERLQKMVEELTEIVVAAYNDGGAPAALWLLADTRRAIDQVHTREQSEFAYEGCLALLNSLETSVKEAAAQGLTGLIPIAGGRHGSSRH